MEIDIQIRLPMGATDVPDSLYSLAASIKPNGLKLAIMSSLGANLYFLDYQVAPYRAIDKFSDAVAPMTQHRNPVR